MRGNVNDRFDHMGSEAIKLHNSYEPGWKAGSELQLRGINRMDQARAVVSRFPRHSETPAGCLMTTVMRSGNMAPLVESPVLFLHGDIL
jgi:hypothetical protein